MGVRRANARDAESVLQVINTSNRDAYISIVPPPQFKDPILTPEQLMKEFDTMNFYVCRVEDQLVGVAALRIDEGAAGAVRWVHVLPEHRRKGVDTSLMKHIENEARDMRLRKLRVIYVWERAHWAKSFYTKLGYSRTDTISLPWGDKAHIYEKALL
jgi:N-acetylglutamate synthase-like GNAT family acetyltransferase